MPTRARALTRNLWRPSEEWLEGNEHPFTGQEGICLEHNLNPEVSWPPGRVLEVVYHCIFSRLILKQSMLISQRPVQLGAGVYKIVDYILTGLSRHVEWLDRGIDLTNFLRICLAFPSDFATRRSGIDFQVTAMFHRARFLVLGGGTSIFPAALLLVLPFGIMPRKRPCSGLSGLLAFHASIAELEHTIALTLSRPPFLSKSSTRT